MKYSCHVLQRVNWQWNQRNSYKWNWNHGRPISSRGSFLHPPLNNLYLGQKNDLRIQQGFDKLFLFLVALTLCVGSEGLKNLNSHRPNNDDGRWTRLGQTLPFKEQHGLVWWNMVCDLCHRHYLSLVIGLTISQIMMTTSKRGATKWIYLSGGIPGTKVSLWGLPSKFLYNRQSSLPLPPCLAININFTLPMFAPKPNLLSYTQRNKISIGQVLILILHLYIGHPLWLHTPHMDYIHRSFLNL